MKNTNFIRLIYMTLILCLSIIILSSCGKGSTKTAFDADPFISIEGEEENGLVYHRESKTVYVLFKESNYGFLAVYILNGHCCEYIDGEIVEVIPEVAITYTEN